jgi:hypothetical protein
VNYLTGGRGAEKSSCQLSLNIQLERRGGGGGVCGSETFNFFGFREKSDPTDFE